MQNTLLYTTMYILDDPTDLKHLEFCLIRNKVFRHCRRLFKDIFLKSCYFHPLSHFLNFLPPADAPWPAVGNLPSWSAGQPPGRGRSLRWNQTNWYIYLFSQGIQISLLILFLLPQVLETKVFITFFLQNIHHGASINLNIVCALLQDDCLAHFVPGGLRLLACWHQALWKIH